MVILLADAFAPDLPGRLSAFGDVTSDQGRVGEAEVIIVRSKTKVDKAMIDKAPKLKFIIRGGVGVDTIDVEYAKQKGIAVDNTPEASSLAVAELAFALMIAMPCHIAEADASMKQGKWLKKEFEGGELFKKTLGVIGFGRIGVAVADRAKAFDMEVLGYDPLIPADEIQKRGGIPVTFDELLAKSDVITMHIPLTAESRGMLNADAFAKMKDGVRIVCAARGGVIDEEALLQALESGKVAAAGLDVFMAEPPGLTPLVSHPRVICTPHIGAQTGEAQGRAAYDIATEVIAGLKGEPLRWKVA